MELFPLLNSLRIALISSIITFFVGIFLAYYISKLNRFIRGILDVILTLPLVLPPTVIGFFILRLLSPRSAIGGFFFEKFSIRLVMTWYSAIFATVIVTFPLMYRIARSSFQNFDMNLKYDKVFSVIDVNVHKFDKWAAVLPFYQNVDREGIVLWTAA